MSAITGVYYCQHAKLNISEIVWTLFHKIIKCVQYVLIIEDLRLSSAVVFCTGKCLPLITSGVQVISDVAKKWLDTESKATFGHPWNQFIVREEISSGNFSDWLLNFSPTCEKIIIRSGTNQPVINNF